jgi:quinol-cytochrome oxidoreductase complex cytochrome b subunit
MRTALGVLLAAVFAVLSLFHIYWALGGRVGSGATVPVVGGKQTFNPSPTGTLLVAAALLLATFTVLGQAGLLTEAIPKWIFRWGTCVFALVFFLRAVGEFKLVGFFKRASETRFAYWDTWLFSPLCLLIAVMAFALVYTETRR